MKYTDITKTEDITKSVQILTETKTDIKVDDLRKQYEVSANRPIMDRALRPDREKKNADGTSSWTPVTRLAIPLQQIIVNSAVSFTFGNPVNLSIEAEDDVSKKILFAINRVLKDNKIDSFNCQMFRDLCRSTEVAECWFPVQGAETHNRYGFPTQFKLRCQLFSPWLGDTLHPIYDATGDMVAFCREYTRKEEGKDVQYLEVYTDEEKCVFSQKEGKWGQEGEPEPNVIGKIPVIYAKQDNVEWHEVQSLIERLEKQTSNFSDTNDYFGSPFFVFEGTIISLPEKAESGKAIQMEAGGKAEVLSWDHGPDSIELEKDILTRFIYSLTQTPDISFESMKGLGQIATETLKMFFTDAHLKVKRKREIMDAYLQRRVNVLLAFMGVINTTWSGKAKELDITPEIVPFTVTSVVDLVNQLTTANGGKAIISQKTSVEKSGLVANADAEYADIVAEQEAETERNRRVDVFEGAV